MKKALIVITLISLLITVGCVNYNSNEPAEVNNDLLKEIEAIEEELNLETQKEILQPLETVKEVLLPDSNTVTTEMQIVTVKENERVSLQPKLLDPDNDPITVTYSKPLDENGQWKTNYGDEGEYIITITAADGTSVTEKQVKLVVEKVNAAPVIADVNDLIFKEGETITFIPNASDPNGDTIQVAVSAPLDKGDFTIDYTSAGEYQITVTASDGELTAEKTFKLTIIDVNMKPELSGLPSQIVRKEGEKLILEPTVSDVDGDKVTVTISNPVGDDGVWDLSYTDHGEYSVIVTASDGKDSVTQTLTVIVEDVNAPVEFLDINIEVN